MAVAQPLWDALCPEWKIVPAPEPREKILAQVVGKPLFKVGETINYAVSFLVDGAPQAGERLEFRIDNEDGNSVSGSIVSGAEPVKLSTTLSKPGFSLLAVSRGKDLNAACGAAVEPEKIVPAPEIEGFDKFWEEQLALLAKTPMKLLSKTPLPLAMKDFEGRVNCFDVQVSCAGAKPVSACLALPKGAKPKGHPAYVFFHGAGVRSAFQPLTWADSGMIALNVNAHGVENGKPSEYYKELVEGPLKNCEWRTVGSPEESPFRDMALRVVRSLEFIKSLPEWDGRNLIVHGGSQGGWQALVAAAFDPQISLSVAAAPAMCNQAGALEGRAVSWPGAIKRSGSDPKMHSIAPFFDGVAFSRRGKGRMIFSVGFSDGAAVPSSIYAAYNVYGGKAAIVDFPENGHQGTVFWLGEEDIKRSCLH